MIINTSKIAKYVSILCLAVPMLVSKSFAQNDALTVAKNGNVGIGNTAPTSPLHIDRNYQLTVPMLNLNQTTPSWGRVELFNGYRYLQTNFAGNVEDGNFKQFNVGPGGIGIGYAPPIFASANALYVKGKVSINSTDPKADLDVSGFAHFLGNIAASSDFSPSNIGGLYIGWNRSNGHGETVFINSSSTQGERGGFTFENINRANDRAELMTIRANSYVGIGKTDPKFPLDIAGYSLGKNVTDVSEVRPGRDGMGYNTDKKPISINSDYGILAGFGYYMTSDRRIKKSFTVANSFADLHLLNQLKVTSFQYKDSFAYGDGFTKGFVAQEVEKLFPQAVSTEAGFIPDVYQNSEKCALVNNVLTITLKVPHKLVSGDVVKLITSTQQTKEAKVTVVNANTFALDNWTGNAGNIFVYGKKVNDFKAVDYQQIFALGISSIQQLSKEVEELKSKNESLQSMMEKMQEKFIALEKRMDAQPTVTVSAIVTPTKSVKLSNK